MYKLTFTALGDISERDWYGVHGLGSVTVPAGTTVSRTISNEHWGQLQPVIEKLSQRRVALTENGVRTGKTGPLCVYTVTRVPSGRPRVHQIAAVLSVLASAPATQPVVLTGENLIPGIAAQAIVNRGLASQLTLTATRKGYSGNRVTVNVHAPSGTGEIAVVPDNLGGAVIDVVPAAAVGPGANAIAAQMTAHAECSRYVAATGGGTDSVGIRTAITLEGGAGAGVSFLDVRTAVDGSYLRIEALTPGNGMNGHSFAIAAASGGGSVTPTNTTLGIDVVVVPAAAADTITDIAAQINAEAGEIFRAVVVGTGSTAVPVTAKSYLYGGSGETPVITVGGAEAIVTNYTDTVLALTVARTDLIAAGLQAGETAGIQILHDYGLLNAGSVAVGQGAYAKAPVRLATAAALPAYTRVGNVITADANGVIAAIDGVALAAGQRILLKDGAAGADNGIYEVTSIGAVGAPFVLTRAGDMALSTDLAPGMEVPVIEGATNNDTTFVLTNDAAPTINSTALVFEAAPGRVRLKTYADLAALPTGSECQLAYLASGRKTGEGGGAGTGIPVYFADSSWRRFYDDAAATE